MSICLSFLKNLTSISVCQLICSSVCLSVCPSIYPSIYLSIYLSIYIAIYLYIYLSIYLFIYLTARAPWDRWTCETAGWRKWNISLIQTLTLQRNRWPQQRYEECHVWRQKNKAKKEGWEGEVGKETP